MIVIAVIGLLVSVLYPLGTWYMSRSRDTNRINDIHKTALHFSTFFSDYREYPHNNPDSECLDTDIFADTNHANIAVPTDPSKRGECDGKYGYGTSTGNTAYILVAYMEGQFRGNYNGLTNGMLGIGKITQEGWGKAQEAQSSGSVQGNKYVYSDGYFMDTYVIPPPA